MSKPTTIRKIQALLDKAASTTFAEEAEALLAKAQELMTRDAIDEALLSRAGSHATHEVISKEVVVAPPYARAWAALLGNVLRANQCRLVLVGRGRGPQLGVMVGFRSDIRKAEALYHGLSLHAIRAMSTATVPSGDGARAFRHAFLLAFASRIAERLRRSVEVAAAAKIAGDDSVALVLADRSAAVDDAVRAQFPRLGHTRPSVSSVAGLAGGRAAADRASLGGASLHSRPALPR